VILVGFTQAPKFDDAAESMPIETLTQSQFNEIMKGERDGKLAKTPVEKPAPHPVEASAPAPPAEPASPKRRRFSSISTIPARTRRRPRPPSPSPKRRRRHPAGEVAAPQPPPPPTDAEVDRPKPRVDPKARRRRSRRRAEDRRETAEKPPSDSVAKFLEKVKAEDEQKPSKPKSADAADPARQPFDPNAIAKLIGQPKPASTRQMASLTPLGSQTQNAPRMSPSLSASLDGCCRKPTSTAGHSRRPCRGRKIRRLDPGFLQP